MQNETIDYKQKYLKYKARYLELKNELSGGWWFNWFQRGKKKSVDKFFNMLVFFKNLNESSNVSLFLGIEGLGFYNYKWKYTNNNPNRYVFESDRNHKIIFEVSDQEIRYGVGHTVRTSLFINKNRTGIGLPKKCTFFNVSYNEVTETTNYTPINFT